MLPLLLLVVQSLIQISAIAAYPVASDFTSPPNTVAYRTIWDIIRSCFATIFSCIWVSVHLNVPEPEGGWHIKWRRRLWATMWALMAPEFVLAWAARQHLAARAIAKKNQELVDGLVVKFMDQEAGSNVENVGEEGVTIESEEGEASGGWLLAPSKDNVNKRSQGPLPSKSICILEMIVNDVLLLPKNGRALMDFSLPWVDFTFTRPTNRAARYPPNTLNCSLHEEA